MAHIEAFRGIRYDLGHVGSLSDVIAPPYDVISPELQMELYRKHPANVIRLILNRDEPGDDAGHNRYTRAARFLKNWQGEGVLQRDSDPAVYVYHQIFEYGGVQHTRRGFMARVRLERFGQGRIYPHEETHSAAKADRLNLTLACRANLSQVFGLYPDEENTCQEILERAVDGTIPFEATDHLGVVHRMWLVTDVGVISDAQAAMADQPIFIADGHHRYETACNYRDKLADAEELPVNHPANYVLMMCVSMGDPGMVVMPTHRLFRGLPNWSAEQLIETLGNCFETEALGEGPELADEVWENLEAEGSQENLALYTHADRRWTLARLSAQGRERMAEVASEHTVPWRGLGVSILHRLIVETLWNARSMPNPKYVHLVSEVVEGLQHGDPENANAPFPVAALVMPATVQHVRTISQAGERMPAKSTYFYPKLLSGLVINPLE